MMGFLQLREADTNAAQQRCNDQAWPVQGCPHAVEQSMSTVCGDADRACKCIFAVGAYADHTDKVRLRHTF